MEQFHTSLIIVTSIYYFEFGGDKYRHTHTAGASQWQVVVHQSGRMKNLGRVILPSDTRGQMRMGFFSKSSGYSGGRTPFAKAVYKAAFQSSTFSRYFINSRKK